MKSDYELNFQPADEQEGRAFEGVLHDFVAREASKPRTESSSVFASYDAPASRWTLAFETETALDAFSALWSARAANPIERRRGGARLSGAA